jgi:predicted transcriptional regulator
MWKDGKLWLVEVPLLDVATQGHTRSEALEMIADAVESLVDRPGFSVQAHARRGDTFELGATDAVRLVALMLRRQREARGVSLSEVAARLGQSSKNSYARYEQGRASPTVSKLLELLEAVAPDRELVLRESRS